MDITISRASSADMSDMVRLAKTVSEAQVLPHFSDEGKEAFRRSLETDVRAMVANETSVALKATLGKELVGYIAWSYAKHINQLYVDGNHQRCDIGTKLLNEMFAHTNQPVLTVNASVNAVQFYEKLGFISAADEKQKNGVRYVPMKYRVRTTPAHAQKAHMAER
jgi:GNAT superfamily N-acetyltransferase